MGFIGMDDIGIADFVSQLLVNGFGKEGGFSFEGHGRGRNEVQSEELMKGLLNGTYGEFEFLTQEHGRSLCGRANQ